MSGAVEGVALPDSELIYQALRFFFWSAGQGVSPINTDDAPEPEETFWQYGLRTGDEEWETVAERYRASLTTPPSRSYANGVPLEVAEALLPYTSHSIGCAIYQQSWHTGAPECTCGVEEARAAIRLLLQGEKA